VTEELHAPAPADHLHARIYASFTFTKALHQVQNLRLAGAHLGFGGLWEMLGGCGGREGCSGDTPLLVSGGQVGQIPKLKICGEGV